MRILLSLLSILLLQSCSPAGYRWAGRTDLQREPADSSAQGPRVRALPNFRSFDPMDYVPDTSQAGLSPVRILRLNFHILDQARGRFNFDSLAGVAYVYRVVEEIQRRHDHNHQMFLPKGNTTPVLPLRLQFVLSGREEDPGDAGIYFHADERLFVFGNRGAADNTNNSEVIRKYAINPDSVLNIFLLVHPPDSMDSPTYPHYGAGVALGNAIKVTGIFENQSSPEGCADLINHEIGHILSLRHAWLEDGCDDTPLHPNCWNYSDKPPCDTAVSNNIMDYNAYKHAWTPCQIGRIHASLSRRQSRPRRMIVRNWCHKIEGMEVSIRGHAQWKGEKDLLGDLMLESGAVLEIYNRVSIPQFARIRIAPGARLILHADAWLHNDCGLPWEGIELGEQGRRRGELILRGSPRIEDLPAGRELQ